MYKARAKRGVKRRIYTIFSRHLSLLQTERTCTSIQIKSVVLLIKTNVELLINFAELLGLIDHIYLQLITISFYLFPYLTLYCQ